jgi:hypothetical protein
MSFKKITILSVIFIGGYLAGHAQKTVVSVGSTTVMTIKTGTLFSADSLVLTPSADFTLATNTIQETATPVPTNPNPTIDRVYYLNSPVSFTGTIQVYYQLSELNGNTEASLFLTDSTVSSIWTSEPTSTVNTVSHFVQLIGASHSFNAVTASGTLIPLPLNLISLAGAWNSNGVNLEWLVEQYGETANFLVESSTDGSSWKQIGEVPGLQANGLETYGFVDSNPSSNTVFYRIKIILTSGKYDYSYIVQLHKGDNNNDIRLIVNGNLLSVYFIGAQPTAIRLINTLGMVLKTDKTSRMQYDLNGLSSGVYFLQYQINGQWNVRKFLIR